MTKTMKKSTLAEVYSGLKSFRQYWRESPARISLAKKDQTGMKTSNSLAGVIYCLVSEHALTGYSLWVNGEEVATGRLGIMLWVLDNAPLSYHEGTRLWLQHKKGE